MPKASTVAADGLDAGLRVGDVGRDVDGAPAQGLDLGDGGLGDFGPAHVHERDVGALAGEVQADGLADAAGAARDEGGLAGQIDHRGTPFSSSRCLVKTSERPGPLARLVTPAGMRRPVGPWPRV